jgi:ferredoxin-NADP reductase
VNLVARARRFFDTPLSAHLAQLSRDASVVLGRDRLTRGPRTTPPRRTAGLQLVVSEVIAETPDAVTLRFAPTPGLTWKAGQFLTLTVPVDGVRLKRAYSVSVAPTGSAPTLAVTVKRIAGGRASNHLVDHARPGDTFEARGPSGNFTFEPDPLTARHVLLVGGGSGITPLISIIETLLADEPDSTATLVYGNRSLSDVIFHDRLQTLAAQNPRLTLRLVLEDAPLSPGRLDLERLRLELADTLPDATAIYVCGPEPVMAAMRKLAADHGATTRLREERFISLAEHTSKNLPTTPQRVDVQIGSRRFEVLVRPGRTLLEAGLAHGAPMPSSCTMGGCGACRVRVLSGELVHDEPNGLTEAEREDRIAFACIAHPLTPCSVEVPT